MRAAMLIFLALLIAPASARPFLWPFLAQHHARRHALVVPQSADCAKVNEIITGLMAGLNAEQRAERMKFVMKELKPAEQEAVHQCQPQQRMPL